MIVLICPFVDLGLADYLSARQKITISIGGLSGPYGFLLCSKADYIEKK